MTKRDQLADLVRNERAELIDLLENLAATGFTAEGEFEEKFTDQGNEFRKTIKFRPSEGLAAKLARLVSIKIDFNLKDLLGRK